MANHAPPSLDLDRIQQVKQRIMSAQFASNTVANYRSQWKSFVAWCEAANVPSLPATTQTCIDYCSWCVAQGARLNTIDTRVRAINFHHREAKLPSPVDKSVWKFLTYAERHLCEKPQGKDALSVAHLRKISQALARLGTPRDIRDRSIILFGFASGWRRSELVSLDLRDIRRLRRGLMVRLGKSKTDQRARGRVIAIHYGENPHTCPVRALEEWLKLRGAAAGPLFTRVGIEQRPSLTRLHPDVVRRAVKRGLELVGVCADLFGAHSLRAGMITAAAEAGATETSIMLRTGQRRYETLKRYVRPAQAFMSNPLAGVL
jgi:integrase